MVPKMKPRKGVHGQWPNVTFYRLGKRSPRAQGKIRLPVARGSGHLDDDRLVKDWGSRNLM